MYVISYNADMQATTIIRTSPLRAPSAESAGDVPPLVRVEAVLFDRDQHLVAIQDVLHCMSDYANDFSAGIGSKAYPENPDTDSVIREVKRKLYPEFVEREFAEREKQSV